MTYLIPILLLLVPFTYSPGDIQSFNGVVPIASQVNQSSAYEESKEAAEEWKLPLINEEFVDNRNKWLLKETDDYSFAIKEGLYRIQSKKGGYWFSTIPVNLNTHSDFEISAVLNKRAGTDNYYFGIVLGLNTTTQDYHFFGITGNGSYAFSKKGKLPKELIPSAPNKTVKKGNRANKLLLKKIKNTVQIYINDKYLGKVPFEGFNGNYFGFQIWSGTESLTVDFDKFQIN